MISGSTQLLCKIGILVLLLNFAGIPGVNAQKDVDVLYLANGNVIRGYLIDQPDSSLIRIETLSHNIYQFSTDEIASAGKELLQTRKNRPFNPMESGYNNITDFGFLIATGYNEKNAIFSALSTHSYLFRNGLSPGMGTGLEFFEQPTIPLYLSCSWQMYTQKFSPFAGVKTGYSFALEDPVYVWEYTTDAIGGMMWSAGIGTRIWLSHRNAMVISLLYRYQGIHSVRTWEWTGEKTELLKKYNRLELRVGFQF